MTDYTPDQLDDIADAIVGVSKDTAKALAEYPRLKEERDDLLAALKYLVYEVNDVAPYLCKSFSLTVDEAEAIIAKVEK